MRWVKRVVAVVALLAVLAIGALFAVQNETQVAIDLLVITLPPMRIATLLLLTFAVGGVIGVIISSLTMVQLQANQRGLQRRLARSEEELARLRTMAKS